jgi:hypothetical protein
MQELAIRMPIHGIVFGLDGPDELDGPDLLDDPDLLDGPDLLDEGANTIFLDFC